MEPIIARQKRKEAHHFHISKFWFGKPQTLKTYESKQKMLAERLHFFFDNSNCRQIIIRIA